MDELFTILHPSYVLRNALYGGIVTGLVLPLIGVFMYCRRMVFLGVTLPQLSTGGIVAAVFWHVTYHQQQPTHSDFLLALLGSTIVTTGTLLLLAALERQGHQMVESRIGTVYVFAGAVTILLLASERIPEVGIVTLLRGQIIAISDMDMAFLLVAYTVIVLLITLFRRELLLVSIDRDLALSLGKRLWVWDILLYGLVGFSISLGVLMVGPLLTFAFLLLPTMIAIQLAKSFFLVPLLGGMLGAGVALIGFILSFYMDWPTGATDSLLACLLLGVITLGQWLRRFAFRPLSR